MDVSVIIVNYNTKKLTMECIDSLRKYVTNISYEVILVDNHSTDGSQELFTAMDGITYLYSKENLGFGRANNWGAKCAKGKYLLLLNSDTLLLNNAIWEFFCYMETVSVKIAGVGCYLLDIKGNVIHSYGSFPTLKTLCVDVIRRNHKRKSSNKKILLKENTVDYITGADLFIRRDVFDKVGGFDSSFFMYYEETDLQHRIYDLGYLFKVIPAPKIIHLEGESFPSHGNTPVKKLEMQLVSRFCYMKKHNSLLVYIVFRVFYALLCTPFVIFFRASWRSKLTYLKKLYS